jgi:hypothetical protein
VSKAVRLSGKLAREVNGLLTFRRTLEPHEELLPMSKYLASVSAANDGPVASRRELTLQETSPLAIY